MSGVGIRGELGVKGGKQGKRRQGRGKCWSKMASYPKSVLLTILVVNICAIQAI